ncbi:MAG TPA: gliding motility-associated C-terminal domain-containing protein [Prolixibacteraceae bacterium]|nr:gliding motility-associated C-terminal domain-containing protein [Prolixibacteraceae bacterium]
MNKYKLLCVLFLFSCLVMAPEAGFAQITSDADAVVLTEYSSGSQDNIHVFCGMKNELNAYLTANLPIGETGTFEWQKYNASSGTFDFFTSDLSGTNSSTISSLENGCYRVIITALSGEKQFTAWAFNNYIEATAEITESDCNSFTLKGTVDTPDLSYSDLTNGQAKVLNKDIQVRWLEGDATVSSFATSQVFDPPPRNTNYTFTVTDRFGCAGTAEVTYYSIVTEAAFTYALENQGEHSDPSQIEAPFTITFTNISINGDADKYEWFIFKDLQKINDEITAGTFKDSIQEIIYTKDPVYTFEEVGEYKVKLVSKKVSEFTTCSDTFYIDNDIIAEVSIIDAPNVFTPNNDSENDKFVVKFFSMKTVKITIFNRWGKILHVYENNNVQGFYNTAETVSESVWDGKVGGRLVSPGVYYYVAEGVGRDGKRRSANGFFHLFRGK